MYGVGGGNQQNQAARGDQPIQGARDDRPNQDKHECEDLICSHVNDVNVVDIKEDIEKAVKA